MKRLAVLLRKFGALSPAERRTLLAAGAWMPVFWLGLRLLGLPRFQTWLQRAPIDEQPPMSLPQMQALAKLVNIAARHTLGPRHCLTRSLLLGWLLRRRGVATALRIGVQLAGSSLDAHAWIEFEGIPVNDRLEIGEQYASFGPHFTAHEP